MAKRKPILRKMLDFIFSVLKIFQGNKNLNTLKNKNITNSKNRELRIYFHLIKGETEFFHSHVKEMNIWQSGA